jgi:hypothetical protein
MACKYIVHHGVTAQNKYAQTYLIGHDHCLVMRVCIQHMHLIPYIPVLQKTSIDCIVSCKLNINHILVQ